MKNLILALFFGLVISLTSSYRVTAQESSQITVSDSGEGTEQTLQVENQGFFARIWGKVKDKATDGVILAVGGWVLGIFTKHGWTLIIKHIANKGKVILKEVGEFASSGSNFLDVVDSKIRDDGSIAENCIKDVIAAGRPLVAECKDVIISIHPKK